MKVNAESSLYSAKSMAEILAFMGPTGAHEIDIQNATWGVAHLIEVALQELEKRPANVQKKTRAANAG